MPAKSEICASPKMPLSTSKNNILAWLRFRKNNKAVSTAKRAADIKHGVHALLLIGEQHPHARDEADQAVANAPLRREAKTGQRIAEHVADCAGEEADDGAKSKAEEHRDRDRGAERNLAQRRHNKNGAVEQPGEHRIQRRADGHPHDFARANFPGFVPCVAK